MFKIVMIVKIRMLQIELTTTQNEWMSEWIWSKEIMVLTKSMERAADQRRPRTCSIKNMLIFWWQKTFNLANVDKNTCQTFSWTKSLTLSNIVIVHKTNLEPNDGEKVSRKFKSSRDLMYLSLNRISVACNYNWSDIQFILRDGLGNQNGWIFGKHPRGCKVYIILC